MPERKIAQSELSNPLFLGLGSEKLYMKNRHIRRVSVVLSYGKNTCLGSGGIKSAHVQFRRTVELVVGREMRWWFLELIGKGMRISICVCSQLYCGTGVKGPEQSHSLNTVPIYRYHRQMWIPGANRRPTIRFAHVLIVSVVRCIKSSYRDWRSWRGRRLK